jgi:hypothetical protein
VTRQLARRLAGGREPFAGERAVLIREELFGDDAADRTNEQAEGRRLVGGPRGAIGQALEERKGNTHAGRAAQKGPTVQTETRL